MKLKLAEINIPEYMTPPKDYRLKAAIRHVNEGDLYPIEVEKTEDGCWILTDGYARYLALRQCGHVEAEVKING